jgi:hypothetical protein
VRERVLELAGDEALVHAQGIDDDVYVWRDGKFH